jgi:hypothetical protein
MTKRKEVAEDPEPADMQPDSDPAVLSEKSGADAGTKPEDAPRDVTFAAIPPVVQLEASDDAEIARRSEARLRGPRQDVQAARERAQSPGFVPAESEESVAFRKLQADVAREVRAEVLQEKIDAQPKPDTK